LIRHRVRGSRSEFLEGAGVGEELAEDAPGLSGGGVERGRGARLEQVQSGHEVVWTATVLPRGESSSLVVWTATVLEARDELEQDAVDAVAEARLVPVGVQRMLLALEEHERADVVVVDRAAGQVEVAVSQGLEHAQTATTTAARQQQ